MMLYQRGSERDNLSSSDLADGLFTALDKIGLRRRVMAVPPDVTRIHSRAGDITRHAFAYYSQRLVDILPAIGAHAPMTRSQIRTMFGDLPLSLFRAHDWRYGIRTLGEVPSEFIKKVSEGKLDYPWPAQVDKLVFEGKHDLILSIGQVVPHEVVGMAGYNKNIFVGTGGADGINKSHFLGAIYGMERIMGHADTPVRRVLNFASEKFAGRIPIVYILTVVASDKKGNLATRGLYIGDDRECFDKAAELSRKVNLAIVEKPLMKAVVYLDPTEFRSTWLGNKSIYRTRMAIADGGELIVLAPGVKEFGEDREIDRLIRKYGYIGTPRILQAVKANDDLKANLSAAAHLIHGSSEGRFSVTYCPGKLSREEIEGVGFKYGELKKMSNLYDHRKLRDGFNRIEDGAEIFYVSNPAVGLWATKERFGR